MKRHYRAGRNSASLPGMETVLKKQIAIFIHQVVPLRSTGMAAYYENPDRKEPATPGAAVVQNYQPPRKMQKGVFIVLMVPPALWGHEYLP